MRNYFLSIENLDIKFKLNLFKNVLFWRFLGLWDSDCHLKNTCLYSWPVVASHKSQYSRNWSKLKHKDWIRKHCHHTLAVLLAFRVYVGLDVFPKGKDNQIKLRSQTVEHRSSTQETTLMFKSCKTTSKVSGNAYSNEKQWGTKNNTGWIHQLTHTRSEDSTTTELRQTCWSWNLFIHDNRAGKRITGKNSL